MSLPSFKRNPQCPKCGHDGIHFEYTAEQSDKAICGYIKKEHRDEHIHLECARCAYGESGSWIMAVAGDPNRTVGFRLPSGSTGIESE